MLWVVVVVVALVGIGYGTKVFEALTQAYDWIGLFVPATALLCTTLHLLDFTHWDTAKAWVYYLKGGSTILCLVMIGLCAALSTKEYPQSLLSYMMLLIPGW